MFIINHKNIFFSLSAALVALSLFAVFLWGLNLSIEFTGGTITEVRFENERPSMENVRGALAEVVSGDVVVQPAEETGYIIKTKELNTEEHRALLDALSFGGTKNVQEERHSLVGPSIGKELRNKAWIAIVFVLLGILLFVAFAFRKVSQGNVQSVTQGVSSWQYSFATIVTLAHDIAIPTGVFSFLGSRFISAQIDVLFVTAILAILGYSVHDTIVVFDRIRENLRRNQESRSQMTFKETVGGSVVQTMARSINTSLTTLLALVALYFLGSEATKNFALVLSIGIVVGTYSSIFLAAPLLVAISGWRRK